MNQTWVNPPATYWENIEPFMSFGECVVYGMVILSVIAFFVASRTG